MACAGRAMIALERGVYTVRAAQDAEDRTAAMALRNRCFGSAGGTPDVFDDTAQQVLVTTQGRAVATFRMSLLSGPQFAQSYSAQYYDLRALERFRGPMLELGRFCIHPDHPDPDILRIAWAALTAYVDAQEIALLFGCSSFAGTNPAPYLDAFGLLQARHLAPDRWAPQISADEVFPFASLPAAPPDLRKATATLPPLLRTYLMMGGWVSDHAVIDREMGTLHVFTGLETQAIPPARKKLLRALV